MPQLDQRPTSDTIANAMRRLVTLGRHHLPANQVFAVALGLSGAVVTELRSLPQGGLGQKLVALRYVVENGAIWAKYFAWESKLTAQDATAPGRLRTLLKAIDDAQVRVPEAAAFEADLSKRDL